MELLQLVYDEEGAGLVLHQSEEETDDDKLDSELCLKLFWEFQDRINHPRDPKHIKRQYSTAGTNY